VVAEEITMVHQLAVMVDQEEEPLAVVMSELE
jgi:hypothetical protein